MIDGDDPYRSPPADRIEVREPTTTVRKPRRISRFALPIYAARRCLRDGVNAAHAGHLDDAIASMRGYVALRASRMASARPSPADAEAAMLAATCAALRNDATELAATRTLIANGDTPAIAETRAWIDVLDRAVAGDLDTVTTALSRELSPIVAPLRGAVLVLAAERGAERLDAQSEPALLALFDTQLSDEARARILVVLARIALARRDRVAATTYLRDIPPSASAFYAFAAALGNNRDELARRWAQIPDELRPATATFAAVYAACATTAVARALVETCTPAPPDARGALLAALAGTLVREGKADDAIGLIAAEPELATIPALRVARCHALVAADRAREALADVATGDTPCSVRDRDLALIVAAAAGDADRVTRLLAISPEIAPSAAARSAVLVHLATSMAIAPSASMSWAAASLASASMSMASASMSWPAAARALPAWADVPPEDPDGLYAWALLETRRGHGAAALPAFARAVAAKPALADGEAIDVARQQVARETIRAGDIGRAHEHLDAARGFEREVSALRAMALIRTAAAREQARLDAASLGPVVRSLLATLPKDGRDHRAVARLAREADELRARWLLLRNRGDEAKPIVKRLADGDAGGFLAAMLAILEEQPIDAIERDLAAAGDARMAGVLLAEVRGARGDHDARVEILESLRARGNASAESLIDEALVQAYQSARRGLDAKRVALEELRRHGKLGMVLATELREALAYEAPPAPPARIGRPPGSSLPAAGVAARAPMLADLVRRRGKSPAILAPFQQAVAAGDLVAAAVAERAVIAACGGAA